MRTRAPKGMTGIFHPRRAVDSVLLAEDVVRDLQNHPEKLLRHAALDYDIDTGTLISMIHKYHADGPRLLKEFAERGRGRKRAHRKITRDHVDTLIPKPKLPDGTDMPPAPVGTFPYILRYRSQHHGRIMLEDPSHIERVRHEIAQERGWNVFFIALFPVCGEAV